MKPRKLRKRLWWSIAAVVTIGLALASQPYVVRMQFDPITGTRQVTRSWLCFHSTKKLWTSPLDAIVYSRRPDLSGDHWDTVWKNSYTAWTEELGSGGRGGTYFFELYEPEQLDRLAAKLQAAIDRGASRSELEEISQNDNPSS